MKRELCKFGSGAFAALAYAHAAYAVATSSGVINEPVFLGRRWGIRYMWTEAAIYSLVSAALGYLGWGKSETSINQPVSTTSTSTDENGEVTTVQGGRRPPITP